MSGLHFLMVRGCLQNKINPIIKKTIANYDLDQLQNLISYVYLVDRSNYKNIQDLIFEFRNITDKKIAKLHSKIKQFSLRRDKIKSIKLYLYSVKNKSLIILEVSLDAYKCWIKSQVKNYLFQKDNKINQITWERDTYYNSGYSLEVHYSDIDIYVNKVLIEQLGYKPINPRINKEFIEQFKYL